jgi:hypothetical protein
MRHKVFSLGLLVLMSVAVTVAPGVPAAVGDELVAKADPFFRPFNGYVSGTYLVTGFPPAGPPFLLLFNVHREGLFSASSQVQATALSGRAFTDDQGIWKKTGRRRITARLVSFNYQPPGTDPPLGSLDSNGIADVVLDFSEDFSTVAGTFDVTNFPFDVNPLDPEAQPLGPPLSILFAGARLTIP